MGGSTGHASIALARRYPELTFIVEDLPEVVEEGPKYLTSQNDGHTFEVVCLIKRTTSSTLSQSETLMYIF